MASQSEKAAEEVRESLLHPGSNFQNVFVALD